MSYKIYACIACITKESDGCVLYQYDIKATPIVCPSGHSHCQWTEVTEDMLKRDEVC